MAIHTDAPELWEAIGISGCPLAIGEAVEIRDCVSGPPFNVADCVDLDVVLVDEEGQRLRFGEAAVDRCTTRPTALSDQVFQRAE